MTGPRTKKNLEDVHDRPIGSGPRSQRRTKLLHNNDVAKLLDDIDLNEPVSSYSNKSNTHFRPRGGKPQGGKVVSRTIGAPRPEPQPKRSGPSQLNPPYRKDRAQSFGDGSGHFKPQRQFHRSEPLKALSSSEHTNVMSRFVVKSELNFSATSLNVDIPLSFREIWRVFQPVQECPICLERAEVPRMLSCGHVMCLHCMMNHRKYSEMPDICPICLEAVSLVPSRTVPVTFLEADPQLAPKEDEEIVLTLMSRPAQSAVALPVNLDVNEKSDQLPGVDMILWARLSQASIEYAKQELASELRYLLGASKQCISEFGKDSEGYSEAAAELKRIIHNLNMQTSEQTSGSSNNSTSPLTNTRLGISTGKTDTHQGSTSSRPHTRRNATSQPQSLSAAASGGSSEPIFFYQTFFESSTVYTLSSLDVSILKAAFGSYNKFPTSLIAKISNIEHTILDRGDKRLKFLSHLPEQIPIALIECDWRGVVDANVLKKFKTKLLEREADKRRRRAKESAENQRAQAAIDMQFRVEIAEAMLPHDLPDHSQGSVDIDPSQLPTLKGTPSAPHDQPVRKKWVDERKEYEELMKNAYVPKKGRKNIVLRL